MIAVYVRSRVDRDGEARSHHEISRASTRAWSRSRDIKGWSAGRPTRKRVSCAHDGGVLVQSFIVLGAVARRQMAGRG